MNGLQTWKKKEPDMKIDSKDSEEFRIRFLLLLSGLIVLLFIAMPERNSSGDHRQGAISHIESGASLQEFLPARQVILQEFDEPILISFNTGMSIPFGHRQSIIIRQHLNNSEYRLCHKGYLDLKPSINHFITCLKIPVTGQDEFPLFS